MDPLASLFDNAAVVAMRDDLTALERHVGQLNQVIAVLGSIARLQHSRIACLSARLDSLTNPNQ